MSPVRVGLVAAALASLAVLLQPQAGDAQACPAGRLLLLTNGRIHTMDARRTVVSKVRVADGRFVEVGDGASAGGGCTDTIDLRGRTVIPGMIDNHFHVQLVGSRPGYALQWALIQDVFNGDERADVIAEVAETFGDALSRRLEAADPPTHEILSRRLARSPYADRTSSSQATFNGPYVSTMISSVVRSAGSRGASSVNGALA